MSTKKNEKKAGQAQLGAELPGKKNTEKSAENVKKTETATKSSDSNEAQLGAESPGKKKNTKKSAENVKKTETATKSSNSKEAQLGAESPGKKKNTKKSAENVKKTETATKSSESNEPAGKPHKKPSYPSKKWPSGNAVQPATSPALSPAYLDVINLISRHSGELAASEFLRFVPPPPLLHLPIQHAPPKHPTAAYHETINASHSNAANVGNAQKTKFAKKPDSGAPVVPAVKLRPIDDVIRRIRSPQQKVLVLLRGCPGSGKSTLAKRLKHKGVVLSADNFFVRNGKYEYDPERLSEAHATVRFQTLEYMQSGVTPIVIDNTNLESWEMEPYMLQAVKLHYFVALLEPDTSWRYDPRVLAKLNSHGVPYAKIVEMLERFDHKINVHVLRQLIQPKIDIYKQQKWRMQNRTQATGAAGDKAPASSGQSVPEPTKTESLLLLDDDVSDKPKENCNANNVLSSNMADLMDINFFAVHSSDGNAQQVADPKVSCSSSNNVQKAPPLASLLSAAKETVTNVSTPTDVRALGTLRDEPFSRGPPTLKTDKQIGLDAIRYEDAVRSLKAHFCSVSSEALHDLVVQCDGDVHYAANLLLDSGYKWENAENSESANQASAADADDGKSVSDDKSIDDGIDRESASNVSSDDDDANSCSDDADRESESGTNQNGGCDSLLMLRIDPLFAVQLEKLFGPVGFHVAPEAYCGHDLSVAIDVDTARVIHSAWALSLAHKFAREEEILKEMLNDESYAERLQQEEDAHIAAKLDAEERDPNFPALTTEALLLDAKSKKIPSKTGDLASRIKLQQLYDMFPKIDPKAVENVFNAHQGNLINTIQAVEDSFRPHEKPGLVIAPELIKELDDTWLRIGQRESLLLHEKKTEEAEALSAMIDPTYEDLRAEATVHYHKRQECFERAQEAHQKNMAAVASFYSQQGHLHSSKLHEANKRAKEIILAKMNDGRKENTLDLHMLHVHEAMEALATFLDQKKRDLKASGDALLTVNLITGKGTHSENGLPRIRPAVLDHLRRHDYRIHEVNGGLIEVNLVRADHD